VSVITVFVIVVLFFPISHEYAERTLLLDSL